MFQHDDTANIILGIIMSRELIKTFTGSQWIEPCRCKIYLYVCFCVAEKDTLLYLQLLGRDAWGTSSSNFRTAARLPAARSGCSDSYEKKPVPLTPLVRGPPRPACHSPTPKLQVDGSSRQLGNPFWLQIAEHTLDDPVSKSVLVSTFEHDRYLKIFPHIRDFNDHWNTVAIQYPFRTDS